MESRLIWGAGKFIEETSGLIGSGPDLLRKAATPMDVSVCRWNHPAHRSFVPEMDQHFVAYHFGEPALVAYSADTFRGAARCEAGSCTYIPAHLPIGWELKNQMHVFNFFVPDRILKEAADFCKESARVSSPRPQVGILDLSLARICVQLAKAIRSDAPDPLEVDQLSQQLSVHLVGVRAESWRKLGAKLSPSQLRRAVDYMQSKLQGTIRLKSLSSHVGSSEFHFARAFAQTTGLAPHAYLSNLRLSRAMRLLSSTQLSIHRIGLEVGFPHPAGFANFFRRYAGVSPRQYRQAFSCRMSPSPSMDSLVD